MSWSIICTLEHDGQCRVVSLIEEIDNKVWHTIQQQRDDGSSCYCTNKESPPLCQYKYTILTLYCLYVWCDVCLILQDQLSQTQCSRISYFKCKIIVHPWSFFRMADFFRDFSNITKSWVDYIPGIWYPLGRVSRFIIIDRFWVIETLPYMTEYSRRNRVCFN